MEKNEPVALSSVVIGSGILEKGGKFLLVNAKRGTPKGLWNNPGGRLDAGESIEECAKREVREETGLNVKIKRLIAVFIYNDVHKYIYETEILGGELKIPEEEIKDAKWFTMDEIKKLPNVTEGALWGPNYLKNKTFSKTYKVEKIP